MRLYTRERIDVGCENRRYAAWAQLSCETLHHDAEWSGEVSAYCNSRLLFFPLELVSEALLHATFLHFDTVFRHPELGLVALARESHLHPLFYLFNLSSDTLTGR